MAPDFSHNKGNRVRFTKLLFRLRFIHCAMAFLSLSFLFFLYPLTTCENLERRCWLRWPVHWIFSVISRLFTISQLFLTYFSNTSQLFLSYFPFLSYFSSISHLFLTFHYFSPISHLFPNHFPLISHLFLSYFSLISQPFLSIVSHLRISQLYFTLLASFHGSACLLYIGW